MNHLYKAMDRRIFINTAKKTRNLNIMKFIPRGGIRL